MIEPVEVSDAIDSETYVEFLRVWPAPWAFMLLALPTGIFQAYLLTTLPYLLSQMGYRVDRIGSLVALVLLPMTLYFIWSPIVDFWFCRKTWIVALASFSAVLLMVAIPLLAQHTMVAIWFLFGGYAVNLMANSAAGGMLALTQKGENKPRAAACMQAGGLAATALGGAALLYFSKHFPVRITCLLAALLVIAPALIALTVDEAPAPRPMKGEFLHTLAAMAHEVRETLLSWKSLPGILLLMSPVGSGAAQGLFAAMASEYRVRENGVMLLNGLLGGVLMMLGALAATMVPTAWDRRLTYVVAGVACSVAGIFLTVAPMVPWVYFVGVGAYLFTVGMCFAFFLGVVMVTMADGHRSASTRFTLLVSLGNLPIVYMTKIEGWGYGLFGPHGIPAMDAAGNLAVAILVGLGLVVRRRRVTLPSSR